MIRSAFTLLAFGFVIASLWAAVVGISSFSNLFRSRILNLDNGGKIDSNYQTANRSVDETSSRIKAIKSMAVFIASIAAAALITFVRNQWFEPFH